MHIKIIAFLLLFQTLLFSQTVGTASWYGEKFQGRSTASGEPFNMYAYTAAHKSLPFGTIVTVTNLTNGKYVNVKINDRIAYSSKRIIDLSFQAAKTIGIILSGTSTVSIVKKQANTVNTPITTSNKLSIYPASNADLASMMEYALMLTNPNKGVRQPVVPNIKKSLSPDIKIQIASFATKQGASEFMRKERSTGYKMEVISLYFKGLKQPTHKVVILTKSKANAAAIVKSNQYNGAYILH